MKAYDYLIVGAGAFGATFARCMTDAGYRCLVIDQRDHIGGNCATQDIAGIPVHRYGPHIFHCNDDDIWAFVNRFTAFLPFVNSPIAISRGQVFSLPFSMYTFNQLWGVKTPAEAKAMVESQRLKLDREPANLEEQALCLVGRDVYERLIRDYTTKQWMRDPKELPASIIRRLPLRFTWNNNYFDDRYQGMPMKGYTPMFQRMLEGIEIRTGVDYLATRTSLDALAKTTVFTGRIDAFFNYELGELAYRTLAFETEVLPMENFQGNAVVNLSDLNQPWTRVVEHKHFYPGLRSEQTVVTRERPVKWGREEVPYYPVRDNANAALYEHYRAMAEERASHVIFGGRLAEYRYYDMHQVFGSALQSARQQIGKLSKEA